MPYMGATGSVGIPGGAYGGGGGGGGIGNFLAALLSQSGMNTNVPPQSRTLSPSTEASVQAAASESGNPLARAARALFAMARANGLNVNAGNYGTSGAFGPGGPAAGRNQADPWPQSADAFYPPEEEEAQPASAQGETYGDGLQSSNDLEKAIAARSYGGSPNVGGGQKVDQTQLMQLLSMLLQGQGRGQGQSPGYGGYA